MASSEENQVIECHTYDDWMMHMAESLDSKKLLVIYFTASWYGIGRFVDPLFAELAKKHPHVVFLKVDVGVDELKTIVQDNKIEKVPTFEFMKERTRVGRLLSARMEDVESKIVSLGAITA